MSDLHLRSKKRTGNVNITEREENETATTSPLTRLRIKRRSKGGDVSRRIAESGTYQNLLQVGFIPSEAAVLVEQVQKMEALGLCEKGLTARKVLRSCLIEADREDSLALNKDHLADIAQLQLGFPRGGALSCVSSLLKGKLPWRIILEAMWGTAGSELGIGATAFRGHGEKVEIAHLADWSFPLPKELGNWFSAFIKGDLFGQSIDLADKMLQFNADATYFVIDCLNKAIKILESMTGDSSPLGRKITRCDISMISSPLLTGRYTTGQLKVKYREEKEATNTYGIITFLEPETIAAETGIPVHARHRQSDIALGNAGAPLAGFQDKLELLQALTELGLTIAIHINLGGQGNAHGVNIETGQEAGDDLGIAAAMTNGAARFISRNDDKPLEVDWDGKLAAAGTPDLAFFERLYNFFLKLLTTDKKSGTEDWTRDNYLKDIFREFEHVGRENFMATVTYFVAKSLVYAIKVRIVPIVGTPQFYLKSGGLWNNPVLNRLFDEEMEKEFGQAMFKQTYEKFRPNCKNDSKELILCGLLAQDGSVGLSTHSVSTGARDASLGTLF